MRKYKPDESGQALLMGLFLLIAGWLAALGCIRLARMLAEEVRVTNANDAVAYSTGIFHARLLNHDAYLNRALINNELAITQWTQLSSRIKTAKTNKLQKLYQYSENAIQEHKRINLTLKAKQDNAHHNIASTRQRLQKDIVVANLSELSGQVNYAQGWRKVGGWHTGGVFQGIDENDARNKTEEERENGAKNETPFTVSNKDESTALVKQEAQKIPYLKKAKEYINSIIPLRTLSTTAANTLLPQHRYRVRTRYSYSSDNTPFDQQNLLTAATTITTSAPSPALDFPYKDFRTDIEIKFIDPENQKEQQGDLLHPYWRPHLKESGQALGETTLLLIVCAALLVGLSQIGVVFKKAHQALINSRHLAFQTAYQQEITPALFPPYPIQSANHLDNILQPSATTFSSEKEMALITHSPTQSLSSSTTEKASSKSSKIQRHTTLLIDSYADKRPVMPLITTDVYLRASHLFPQSSHFPHVFSLEFEQLLKKIEGDLAVPSLATS